MPDCTLSLKSIRTKNKYNESTRNYHILGTAYYEHIKRVFSCVTFSHFFTEIYQIITLNNKCVSLMVAKPVSHFNKKLH